MSGGVPSELKNCAMQQFIFNFKGEVVIITPANKHLKGCHAGLDPASSLFQWILVFAGMTEI